MVLKPFNSISDLFVCVLYLWLYKFSLGRIVLNMDFLAVEFILDIFYLTSISFKAAYPGKLRKFNIFGRRPKCPEWRRSSGFVRPLSHSERWGNFKLQARRASGRYFKRKDESC